MSPRITGYLVNACAGLITLVCVLWVMEVPRHFGVAFFREQFLAPVLGLSIVVVYLGSRASGRAGGRVPWYDLAAAALGLAVFLWITIDYRRLLEDVVGIEGREAVVIGGIVLVLVMEGLRRTSGYSLFCVVLAFIAYAFVGDLVPGQLKALPVGTDQLLVYLTFAPTAVFGIPMIIGAEVVIIFILLGQLLVKSGGGEFFTDIAMATMGRQRGGAAKISIVASALFGSISGSATSNVASTGVITIPLMRRSGYSAVDAGAIESVASTGGQFMPPIMGAAAFLMAEFLEISYASVIVAALIPALLYYFAVFVQVDLVAAREHVRVLDADLPRAREVLGAGWHFILPFAILLVCLFEFLMAAEQAALYAAASVVVLGMLRPYKGQKLGLQDLVACFWSTAKVTVDLFLILGAAGFVIGVLNVTGLGFALTFFLVQLGGGNLFLLLLIAALTCIVLGMGMPTSGVYVLLAALIAPAIVEAGVQPLAAHMFILYFGMMSMITPPVALAAFTAAGLTQASAMRTGMVAMRLGWTAYIIPVLFVLSPTLLMFGEPLAVAFNFATALAGVYLISCAFEGWFARPMAPLMRVLVGISGFAALTPAQITPGAEAVDIAGILAGAALLAREHFAVRRRRAAPAE